MRFAIVLFAAASLGGCAAAPSFDTSRAITPSLGAMSGEWLLVSANGRDMRRQPVQRKLAVRENDLSYSIDDCNSTNSTLSQSKAGFLRIDEDAIMTTAGCHPVWKTPSYLEGVGADFASGMAVRLDPTTGTLQLQGETHRLIFVRQSSASR